MYFCVNRFTKYILIKKFGLKLDLKFFQKLKLRFFCIDKEN